MSNLNSANLVRSVVAERGLVPVMSHFHFYNGRIQGTDGKLTLDAPWEGFDDEELNVPAAPLVKAFEAMENPKLQVKGDKLLVTHGKMRVRIPLSTETFPRSDAPECNYALDDSFLDACRRVRAFIGTDLSRMWACGILYRDGWIYATNNVSMVRVQWQPNGEVPPFTLPSFAIDQLCRARHDVIAMRVRDVAIDFELAGDVWLKSARHEGKWPDVEKMFPDFGDVPELPEDLSEAVEKVLPFVPDPRFPVIRFTGDKVATLEGEMQAEIELECTEAAFHAQVLQLVLGVARYMDFSQYPKPCPFLSADKKLQGIAMGVRT